MNDSYLEDLAETARYFWNYYEDLERSDKWNEIKVAFPDLAHAVENFKTAKRLVGLELMALG